MWKQWLYNIAAGFDRMMNAVFGGDPRETISSRLGKYLQAPDPKCRLCRWTVGAVCAMLNLFQRGHCVKAEDPTVGDKSVLGDK